MSYKSDVFYDLSELSLGDKIELMKYCKSICDDWWVDKLDCSESWGRQHIKMEFEKVLEKCDKSTIFNVIHRRGNDEWKDVQSIFRHKNWSIEVGFTTMGLVSYYLWMYMSEDKLEDIINKFNLKVMT